MRSIAAIAILFISLPASAGNLMKDGGFETPPTPPNSYIAYDTGSSLGPWTVVGAAGNVATVASGFTQDGFDFKAKSGKAWLDLTGTSNTASGVAQTVKTVPGTSYTLSFWVGNVYDPNGIFGTSSTVNVFDGSTMLLRATNRKVSQNKQVWQKFSVTFLANAAKTTLSFINGDPANDTNNGLDAVSLVKTAPAAVAKGLH